MDTEDTKKRMDEAFEKLFEQADIKDYMLVRYRGDDKRIHWHKLLTMTLYGEPVNVREYMLSTICHGKFFYKLIKADYGEYEIGIAKETRHYATKSKETIKIMINHDDVKIHLARVGRKKILRLYGYSGYHYNDEELSSITPEIFDEAFGFTL